MRNPDPFSQLSRHTANSVENTPEVMAMRQGDRYIPQTWGSLASAAVEAGLVEPEAEAICNFFNIEANALQIPEVVIQTQADVNGLYNNVTAGKRNLFVAQNAPQVQAYKNYLTGWLEQYRLEDPEEVLARK